MNEVKKYARDLTQQDRVLHLREYKYGFKYRVKYADGKNWLVQRRGWLGIFYTVASGFENVGEAYCHIEGLEIPIK